MSLISEKLSNLSSEPSPLNAYRQRASFCSQKMKYFLEDEKVVQFKNEIWQRMEQDILFHRPLQKPSLDELRELATKQAKRFYDYGFLRQEVIMQDFWKLMPGLCALGFYDAGVLIKYSVPFHFFDSSIRGLGNKDQARLLDDINNEDMLGCFALTEVAHGTDAKNMKTKATYNEKTEEFILHTPDFEAAKCWVGNLGQSSVYATIFAQLYTPDGVCHGLHAFLTPIRDPETMLSYPGVIVGDMGQKIGLNCVDNGFAIFNNYRIPRSSLLSRTGSVSKDGKYISPIKDPRKRFGASLGALVGGRIMIVQLTTANLIKAVTIAIRYSAARKQFGPSDGQELPVIEYQMQQWRLFPYLAAAYAHTVLGQVTAQAMIDFSIMTVMKDDNVNDFGAELHSVMSAAKPISSWIAQKSIQECREACGGHGYLACSGFGDLRNDNDANCTYEGENNVLLQQSSNWLLTLWRNRDTHHEFPLGSVSFISLNKVPRCPSSLQQIKNINEILAAYDWLLCYLLDQLDKSLDKKLKSGQDSFTARNNCQVFLAKDISLAYVERFILYSCQKKLVESSDTHERRVFEKVISLYGLWSLNTHLSVLYEGGFAEGPQFSCLLKQAILELCEELKPDSVALVDAIAPTDFILNSAIGKYDGQIYKNLQAAIFQSPGVFERPSWWKEITKKHRSRL